jgi:negative regulator of flagellin synthesis FlgM
VAWDLTCIPSTLTETYEKLMKITDIKGLGVEELTAQQVDRSGAVSGKTSPETTAAATDIIQLSPQARLMHKASEVVYHTPDVRPEKVAALQEAVQQGTYQVDSKKVANRLITEILLEK